MVLAIRLATTTQESSSTWPSEAAMAGSAVATTVPSAAARKTGRTIGGNTVRNSFRGGGYACASTALPLGCTVVAWLVAGLAARNHRAMDMEVARPRAAQHSAHHDPSRGRS